MFLLLLATAARAQAPIPTTQPTQPSLQQMFDIASEAVRNGDCAKALPIFEKLARDPRVKPGSLPAGAIAVRGGHCLIMAGRKEDGEAWIETGLPIMRKAGADFAGDVAVAERELGDIALLRGDHDAAVTHFQGSLASLKGEDRVGLLLRLAMATAFDGGPTALAYADDALNIEEAEPKPDRKLLSRIHDIHGEILLNQGQNRLAYSELKQAIDLAGGLTDVITHEDVVLRGDLAQAALLNGDRDKAREYLAYTGAGHISESPFTTAIAMEAPECGDETGLRPEDSAIVEFAIAGDGSVSGAQTIYSRGDFAVAAAFAKAVDAWFWRPEDIAKLPSFYRTLTRVEIRCSNRGGNVPSVETPLIQRFSGWASTVVPNLQAQAPVEGARLQVLKDMADRAIESGDGKVAAAELGAWAVLNPRVGQPVLDGFDKAIALGQQAGIPVEALDALRVLRMPRQILAEQLKSRGVYWHKSLKDWAGFLPFADNPTLASDPLATDTLLMMAIPQRLEREDRDAAVKLAQRVADDGRLPDRSPLRQAALLWLANQAAQDGQLAEAQAYFLRTGLNEQQCALIGQQPAMRYDGVWSNDYPEEALKMGFEGWVKLEFNINANGTTADARPLISYPPFVFEDAATGMARHFRYQASYRPSGGEACSAQSTSVRFLMPR